MNLNHLDCGERIVIVWEMAVFVWTLWCMEFRLNDSPLMEQADGSLMAVENEDIDDIMVWTSEP